MSSIDYNKALDNEGLTFIVDRYKDVYNMDNITYEFDSEKNVYSFKYKNGDQEILIGQCPSNTTVAGAITLLDNQYLNLSNNSASNLAESPYKTESGNSVGGVKRGLNKVPKANPNTINLNFDKDEFDQVSAKLQSVATSAIEKSEIEDISSGLTGKLREWYSSQSKNIASHEVADIKDQIDVTREKINACVELVNNTDESLRQLLVSTIDQVFSINMIKGAINHDEIEARKQELQGMIDQASDYLNQLKEYFNAKCYDLGVPLTADVVNMFMPFFDAIGLGTYYAYSDTAGGGDGSLTLFGPMQSVLLSPAEKSSQDYIYENDLDDNARIYTSSDGNAIGEARLSNGSPVIGFDPQSLDYVFEMCDKYDLFNSIKDYVNGANFEDTGLYRYMASDDNLMNIKGKWSSGDVPYEEIFLSRYLGSNINNCYGARLSNGSNDYENYNSKYAYLLEGNNLEEYLAKQGITDINADEMRKLLTDDFSRNEQKGLYNADVGNEWNVWRDPNNGIGTDSNKKMLKTLMRYMITDDQGEYIDFKSKLEDSYNGYLDAVNDITSTDTYLKTLKEEKSLVDYNYEKESIDYLPYLAKNYNSSDIENVKNLVNGEYKDVVSYLTQDEFALVEYYLDKGNKDKANSYLKTLQNRLNQRKGFDDAVQEFINNPDGFDRATAFGDGVAAWWESVKNVFGGGDDPTTPIEYKNMFMSTILEAAKHNYGDRGIYEELLKDMTPAGGWYNKFAYTMWNQAGNMMIPVVAGLIVGAATGGSGFALLGSTVTWGSLTGGIGVGLGAMGSAMGRAVSRGETDVLKVYTYGFLNGLSEAGFEMFMGSMPGIGKFFQKEGSFFKKCLAEGKEEFFQTYIEAGLNSIFFGDEFNFGEVTGEAATAGFYGFCLAAVFNGADFAFNYDIDGIMYRISGNPSTVLATLDANNGDLSSLTNPETGLSVEFDVTERIKSAAQANGNSNIDAFMDKAYYDSVNHQVKIIMNDGSVYVYSDVDIDMGFNTESSTDTATDPDAIVLADDEFSISDPEVEINDDSNTETPTTPDTTNPDNATEGETVVENPDERADGENANPNDDSNPDNPDNSNLETPTEGETIIENQEENTEGENANPNDDTNPENPTDNSNPEENPDSNPETPTDPTEGKRKLVWENRLKNTLRGQGCNVGNVDSVYDDGNGHLIVKYKNGTYDSYSTMNKHFQTDTTSNAPANPDNSSEVESIVENPNENTEVENSNPNDDSNPENPDNSNPENPNEGETIIENQEENTEGENANPNDDSNPENPTDNSNPEENTDENPEVPAISDPTEGKRKLIWDNRLKNTLRGQGCNVANVDSVYDDGNGHLIVKYKNGTYDSYSTMNKHFQSDTSSTDITDPNQVIPTSPDGTVDQSQNQDGNVPSNPETNGNENTDLTNPDGNHDMTNPNENHDLTNPNENNDVTNPDDNSHPDFIVDPNGTAVDQNQNTDLTVPEENPNQDLTIPEDPNQDLTIPEDPNHDITNPEQDQNKDIIPNPDPDPNPNPNQNQDVEQKPWIRTNYWPWVLPIIPIVIGTIIAVSTISGLTLTLKGSKTMEIIQNEPYVEPGYTAYDKKDGDLTSKVVVKGTVKTDTLGTYVLEYSVTNSENETASDKRTVKVVPKPSEDPDPNPKPKPHGGDDDTEDKFDIREFTTIPKKYMQENNKREILSNVTSNYLAGKTSSISSIGTNNIADGTHYSDLSSCDSSIKNKEASLVSIYINKVLSTYHDSKCYANRGVIYFPSNGNMVIKNVSDKTQYDAVVSAKPRDTFIYEKILVSLSSKVSTSTETSDNIAICSTGSSYKVFIPKSSQSLSDYGDAMTSNSCINGVLLPGNSFYEGGTTTVNPFQSYDSMMYFE